MALVVAVIPFAVTVAPDIAKPEEALVTLPAIVPFTEGGAITVTVAVPETFPLVAFTIAVPGASAVNVVVAVPFIFVVALDGLTVPTVILLLVQFMFTPGTDALF